MSAPHAPVAGAMVGRTVELERLNAALDAVSAGDPRMLVVTGEPGIGKSRILG